MTRTHTFAELSLDETALHTPVGVMPLVDLTRAEFRRQVDRVASAPTTQETSATAVVGGAAVGGALFGGVGALVGGVLGSTVKEDVPGTPRVHTASVKLIFETPALTYSLDVEEDHEMAAYSFAERVRKAAGIRQTR
ncbi:MAG TPA: hypothetical protein VFG89_02250 [Coriobacteriia bacterium]|nr:hypothetical protein [Coriobacteriia bacterium]